jgi:hypothetical protein
VVKFDQIKERIKLEFPKMEIISDWIQIQILHMFQCFDHNFLLQYQIKVIQKEVESYLKMLQFIVKKDFPNSDVDYVKIIPQYENANLSESYHDFRLLF